MSDDWQTRPGDVGNVDGFARPDDIDRLEADVALLTRAVAHLLDTPGQHGRWTREDYERLGEILERRDRCDACIPLQDPPTTMSLYRPYDGARE